MSEPLKEANIKLGILKLLEEMGFLEGDAAIASELAVAGHKRRIDLAVFGSATVGIEIKSDVDTLKRLHDQAVTYLPYFDHLLVIVADRHVTKALDIVPPQVSVWSVNCSNKFTLVRRPLTPHTADIWSRLKWLTLKDLRRLVPPEHRSAGRSTLVNFLREAPPHDLREKVDIALRSRFDRSTKAFRMEINEPLRPDEAIARLSRSYDRRIAEKALAERSKELWSKWQSASFNGDAHAVGSKR